MRYAEIPLKYISLRDIYMSKKGSMIAARRTGSRTSRVQLCPFDANYYIFME